VTNLSATLQRVHDGWGAHGASRLYPRFISLTNASGTVWIFALMLLIVTDIIGRWLFNLPVTGVPLIVSHSIVGIVFLQLASTLEAGRVTRTSVFIGGLLKTRPFAAAVYQLLFHSLGVVVLSAITIGTYPLLEKSWATGEWVGTDTDVSFVIWPLKAIIVLGAALTAIQFLILASRDVFVIVTGAQPQAAVPSGAQSGTAKGWRSIAVLGVVLAIAALLAANASSFSNMQIGLLSVGAMLVLIYSGMHIAIALIVLSFCGMWIVLGAPDFALKFLAQTSNIAVNEYIFGVVPLFVLTGLLVSEAGFGAESFEVAEWVFGRLKGGLGVATVAANAVFAAITGVSLASAAVFTRVAVPPMIERGYTPKFAVGIVAGSSVLGMLIPPSLLLIVYGIISEVSVGKLFLAAIIPGLILATAFALVIVVMARFMPNFVGVESDADKTARLQAQSEETGAVPMSGRVAAIKMVPIGILMLVVLGGIYGGVFTPTEAGAAGAFAALVLALVKRRINWSMFWNVMLQTGHISTGVLFLIMASKFYAQMLALSGLPAEVMGFVVGAELDFAGVIIGYMAVLLILGMILDPISILLITLPVILPVIAGLGGDLVWFGIVTIIAVEAGLLTPPLGLTVFVVQGIMGDDKVSVTDVFKGSFPFVVTMVLVLILLIALPQLSLVFV